MPSIDAQLTQCLNDVPLPSEPRVAITLAEHGTTLGSHWQGTHGTDLYEIGSVSKALLGLAVAKAVNEKNIALDDVVQQARPKRGRQIGLTLRSLVTHTSGLRRMPPGFTRLRMLPAVMLNKDPYRANRWTYQPDRPLPLDTPGKFSYSNLGCSVVGQYLAETSSRPFDDIVKDTVLQPLGLHQTVVQTEANLVQEGYSSATTQCAPWVQGTLAPGGGWTSTPHDMALFAETLSTGDVPGNSAWTPLHHHSNTAAIGIFWVTSHLPNDGPPVVWHNGATWGYTAYIGYRPDTGRAVSVLLNRGTYRTEGKSFDPRTLGEAILALD